MRFKKKMIVALLLLSAVSHGGAQEKADRHNKMEWFDDAKLGIFIHWGIYSVQGIFDSWDLYNNYISHPNYMKLLEGFTSSADNPEEWIKLIEESGARYAVVAAKHHDGVALWYSKAADALTTARHGAV